MSIRSGLKKYINEIKTIEKEGIRNKIDASSAYSVTVYGRKLTAEGIIKSFYENIECSIKSRSTNGLFSAVFDVTDSYVLNEIDNIVSHYRDLGFYVKFISNKSEGFNELTGEYLFISWKK